MGAEKDCLLSLCVINTDIFGGVGFDHPEHLNFSFPKASAAPAVLNQMSLLPRGVRGYTNIGKSNFWLYSVLVLK